MLFFDYLMKLTGSNLTTTSVTCPLCGFKSSQQASKIRLKRTMLCPGCKALFIAPH
ncbi:transposase [Providencia alcalifaciens]|nr:transposase [Providencia alcalifaciens]